MTGAVISYFYCNIFEDINENNVEKIINHQYDVKHRLLVNFYRTVNLNLLDERKGEELYIVNYLVFKVIVIKSIIHNPYNSQWKKIIR